MIKHTQIFVEHVLRSSAARRRRSWGAWRRPREGQGPQTLGVQSKASDSQIVDPWWLMIHSEVKPPNMNIKKKQGENNQ